MDAARASIRPIFRAWPTYNEAIVEAVGAMTGEQLALRAAPDQLPLWAIVAHLAGARVYWLCGVLGEPGAETTPFPDPVNDPGWEDDEDHPRSATELVGLLTGTWRIVDDCLGRWTPADLDERFVRVTPTGTQHHSRAQVLLRLLSHDAYHAGEVSQTLGVNGWNPVYLWRPDEVTEPPA
jgi:uncharacterized damage-inducible protein DinB